MHSIPADNELNEGHLVNFVVNSLAEELPLDLGDRFEVTVEKLYKVLAGASPDGTSINHMRPLGIYHVSIQSVDTSPINLILTPSSRLEIHFFSEIRLRRYLIGRWRSGLHPDPCYGEEEKTKTLYFSKAKHGATLFHAYATLHVRVRNKRYTLAVRQLTAGETTDGVLSKFFELLAAFDLGVKTVYSDRDFCNSTCLNLLYAYSYAISLPIIKGGRRFKTILTAA